MSYLTINTLNEDFKTAVHNTFSSILFGDSKDGKINKSIKTGIQGAIGQYAVTNFLNPLRMLIGMAPISPLIIPTVVALRIGATLIGAKDIVDRKYFYSHWSIPYDLKIEIAKWCKQQDATIFTPESNGSINHTLGKNNKRLAINHANKGETTTCIPISAGQDNQFYYVYPIFDSSDIFDLKALKYDKRRKKYKIIDLTQWDQINHQQFKK